MTDPNGSTPPGARRSWYLDPLVAAQKRDAHLALLRAWSNGQPSVVLKTDLFEEANGADELMSGFPDAATIIGMDVDAAIVGRARARGLRRAQFLVTDARRLALAAGSVDLVFSNSTLDHFDCDDDLAGAIDELVRVLRPGGRLIVTMDNPRNPLYALLRWVTRRGWSPFVLGRTVSRAALEDLLRRSGIDVEGSAVLIHNPRLLSTALFLTLRRLLGRRADAPVGLLLRLFDAMSRLPTRELTACFVAVCGRKPSPGAR